MTTTSVTFTLNGEQHTVDVSTTTGLEITSTLNDYIRQQTTLTGTKRSCGEGGCGACMVMLKTGTKGGVAINSCLRPLLTCNGQDFVTIEGIGSQTKGYQPIQTKCASSGGSQCGFCSPGFAMSMYSLLSNSSTTPQHLRVDEALQGNICRCTGFRPILQSFYDAPPPANEVESKLSAPCLPLQLTSGATWIDVSTEQQLSALLLQYSKQTPPPKDVMLVGARTSFGIWKTRSPDVYLHIAKVGSLKNLSRDSTTNNWEIGTAVPIQQVINYLGTFTGVGCNHIPQVVSHLGKVAAEPIRNVATIGGNIMLTHLHQHATDGTNFAYSDVTTLLYGYGATLKIHDAVAGVTKEVSFDEFYATDMTYCYLVSIIIPASTDVSQFKSFRIAARNGLSHPYAVASIKCNVVNGVINGGVNVVLGGIANRPAQYLQTATAMLNMNITDISKFRSVCGVLQGEAVPTPVEGRVSFRNSVVVSFLYKFFLSLQTSLPAKLQNEALSWFPRQAITASAKYSSDPTMFPITKPEPNIDALRQVGGEVQYIDDLETGSQTMHLAVVLSSKVGKFSFDTTKAKGMSGFIGFYQAKDMTELFNDAVLQGPVVAESKSEYVDQIIAVVAAQTAIQATDIARAVDVTYTSVKQPIISVDQAVEHRSFHFQIDPPHVHKGDASKAISNSPHKVTSKSYCAQQYHFHMETQSCMAKVNSSGKGIHVYVSTQAPSLCAAQVQAATGLLSGDVTVETPRCGGGYGGKLFNSFKGACITAALTKQFRKPSKMVMALEENMRNMGTRFDWRFDYSVGFQDDGTITGVEATFYTNCGYFDIDASQSSGLVMSAFDNCYNIPNWKVEHRLCKTDVPPGTSMRGPGYVPGVYFIESIIDRVSSELNITPDAVRQKNFYKPGDVTPYGMTLSQFSNMDTLFSDLKQTYGNIRKSADAFNAANLFTKKGVCMVPVKYGMNWANLEGLYSFMVDINIQADASIAMTASGVELGQGLAVKVSQVISHQLGAPQSLITNDATSTKVVNDIGSLTAYSTTSELCCAAALNACAELNKVLAPVRKSLPPTATWTDVVKQAITMGVKLHAKASSKDKPTIHKPDQYNSYCAAVIEVQLDTLTGEIKLPSINIAYDAGKSINPMVDRGQVEGAFMQGLGYVLTEEISRNPTTGVRTARNTWEYHVPSVADTPENWSTLLTNITNPDGILSSKATGEPTVCLGAGVAFAVADAIRASGEKTYTASSIPIPVADRMLGCNPTMDFQKFVFQ